MRSEQVSLYRGLLQQLRKSATPPRKVNRSIIAHFRSIAERYGNSDSENVKVKHDIENATHFFRAQREHKVLLDRYNPLFDLTDQERIRATARRVGLDMPVNNASKDQ